MLQKASKREKVNRKKRASNDYSVSRLGPYFLRSNSFWRMSECVEAWLIGDQFIIDKDSMSIFGYKHTHTRYTTSMPSEPELSRTLYTSFIQMHPWTNKPLDGGW